MNNVAQSFNNLACVADAFESLEKMISDADYLPIFSQLNSNFQKCLVDLDEVLHKPQ